MIPESKITKRLAIPVFKLRQQGRYKSGGCFLRDVGGEKRTDVERRSVRLNSDFES